MDFVIVDFLFFWLRKHEATTDQNDGDDNTYKCLVLFYFFLILLTSITLQISNAI